MKLEIITPDKIYFSGEVTAVTFPGSNGLFTVKENHAPIISLLSNGKIKYTTPEKVEEIDIESGFVEVNNNIVSVCTELV